MKYNFIIPYRNRKENLDEFIKRFTEYLNGKDLDVQFYFIHQINPKEFNRGAMKNIGFMEVCKSRSDGLFIFHDVDTYPTYWGSIPYETLRGECRRPVENSSIENLGLICCWWKEDLNEQMDSPIFGDGVQKMAHYIIVHRKQVSELMNRI